MTNKMLSKLTGLQDQIIMGTLLGDADIAHKERNNCSLRIGHKGADRDYLLWKWGELKSTGLFTKSPRPRVGGFGSLQWRLVSSQSSFFNQYREMFYPEGLKIVTQEVLDKLSDLGLAVWYMDDGGLGDCGNRIFIHTQSFGIEGNRVIKDWFDERYGLHFQLHPCNGSRQVNLSLHRRGEVKKFLEITRPYAIPCMGRKWGGEL